MIILTIKKKKVKFYIKTTQNSNSSIADITGNCSIKNYKNYLILKNILLKKDNKKQEISQKDFLSLLKENPVYLTRHDDNLEIFLKENDISYSIEHICSKCLNYNEITLLDNKISYEYNQNTFCIDCAEEEIKEVCMENQYHHKSINRFIELLHQKKDLYYIFDIIFNNKKSLESKYTLYDKIELEEDNFAQVSIDDLDIPGRFKNILKEKVDYLLPVQILSLNKGLLYNENLLVVSPTASGKTLIGELAGIPKALQNKKFIYLTPLVALANQKYRYFKKLYSQLGLKVVIKVGSNKINADEELHIVEEPVDEADIIIATYEGLDYILRSGRYDSLNDLGVVVIDEIHMLENPDRGNRLNGLIYRLLEIYPQSQLIGLSATIKNPENLANEFNMQLVLYDKRPVSLERHLLYVEDSHQKDKFICNLCKHEFENISKLGFKGQTIIFTDSRRKTHQIAKKLNDAGISASSYHAGLTYANKVDIEVKYANQEISTVVTTAALAAGVDFPASLVIFDSLRMGKKFLSPNEFHQMVGRAGRPSYQDKGKAYIIAQLDNEFNYNYEDDVALSLLESSVDSIVVNYNFEDILEQILADISSKSYVNFMELESKYLNVVSEVIFDDAIDRLIDTDMVDYDKKTKLLLITGYGRAVSKSFLKIKEAEYIRNNITDDPIDIVVQLEYLTNVYLTGQYIKRFSEYVYHPSIRLFSNSNKELITNPDIIGYLPKKQQNQIYKLLLDFNINDYYDIYDDYLELNISKEIIKRRVAGCSPLDINKEFREEYGLYIYTGDIYKYLDQSIRYLEAIERISNVFGISSVKIKTKKLIKSIEG